MRQPPGSLDTDLLLQITRREDDPAGLHRVTVTVPGYDGVGELSFDLDARREALGGLSLLQASHECQKARRPGEARPVAGLDVGRAVVDAILAHAPEDLATLVRAYGDAQSHIVPRRIVVAVDGSASTAGHLLFEAWNRPALTERVRLVRWRDIAAPPPTVVCRPERVRILILVGDVEQRSGANDREKEYVRAVRALHKGLAALGAGVEVSTWVTVGAIRDDTHVLHSDLPLASPTDVLWELEHGRFHVVVYLGHSDAHDVAPGQEATALQLAFGEPGARRIQPLRFEDLAHTLAATDTRLLVLLACVLRAEMADGLLTAVDHVLGVPSLIDPDRFEPLGAALGSALSRGGTAGECALRMRASLAMGPTLREHEGWQVVHYARTLHDRLLFDADQARLHEYHTFLRSQHARPEGLRFANVEGEDATLDRVYVELELESGERFRQVLTTDALQTTATADGAWRGVRFLGRMPLAEMVQKTARDAAWITGRWVVLAVPGAGKTTILRKLAFDLASADDVLPVYLHLGTWPSSEGQPVAFAAALDRMFGGLAELFASYDQRGRCVVLLDGLDEVPNLSPLRDVLHQLVARVRSPVVVASRKLGYSVDLLPPAFKPARILSLNEDDHTAAGRERARAKKLELLRKLYAAYGDAPSVAETRAQGTLARLTDRLWELTSTPLFVHLVGFLELKGYTPVRFRHEVFRDVITCLLRGQHQGMPVPMPNESLAGRALARLAFEFTCARTTRRPRKDVTERIEAWSRAPDPRAKKLGENMNRERGWDSASRFLDLVGKRTSLLVADDVLAATEANTDWRFWMKSIQDALTAEFLFHEVYVPAAQAATGETPDQSAGLDAVWTRLGPELAADEGRLGAWGETLALFTAHLGPAERERWIERLAEAHNDLALRALAFADVGRDLLVRILGLEEGAGQRARVYREVAARLSDDPLTLVPTLMTCVRATTNGDDLYVLDELLAEVDVRLPGQATSERRALFAESGAGVRSDHETVAARVRGAFRVLPDGTDPWCDVPSGWFRRGSPEDEGHGGERPALPVHITMPVVIGATTITQEQYALFDPSHRRRWPADHMPVTDVSWYAATMFARWLGHQLGVDGRLPTEAEWEYACRGQRCESAQAVRGASWPRYWCGEHLMEAVAWFGQRFDGRPRPAHEGVPNPFGLCNVHGNVWEWCADWRGPYQSDADGTNADPAGPVSGSGRVLRGGGFWSDADNCRSAYRNEYPPALADVDVGFRVVLSARPRTIDV